MRAVNLAEVEQATGGRLGFGLPETVVASICTDSRALTPGDVYWALVGEKFDGHAFLDSAVSGGAAACVVQRDHCPPGFAAEPRVPTLLVPDSLTALGDFAHAYRRRYHPRTVGITGSVGKTSTKDMLAEIARARFRTLASEGNYNNFIGLPKTLLRLDESIEVMILEMGADRPGEIRRLVEIGEPEIGVITAISETHLYRLKDLDGVAREKGELFAGLCGERPLAIVPHDLAKLDRLAPRVRGSLLRVGDAPGLRLEELALNPDGCAVGVLVDEDGARRRLELCVPGLHQARNALLALAAGRALGVPLDDALAALRNYRGFWGRLRPRKRGDCTILEDVYNSNPQSLYAALELLMQMPGKRRIAVLGDMLDLGEHSVALHEQCGQRLGALPIDLIYTFGDSSRIFLSAARRAGRDVSGDRHFDDLGRLIAALKETLSAGDLALIKGSRGMKMERLVEAILP